MNILKIAVIVVITLFVTSSIVIAKHHIPEERGKTMFSDPKFSGGTSGKSCGTCHADGQGLEGVADKKEWKTPGGAFTSLEEVINICITMALKGKALDVKSEQMKDFVSYLKTFKAKAGEAPKKKAPVGC